MKSWMCRIPRILIFIISAFTRPSLSSVLPLTFKSDLSSKEYFRIHISTWRILLTGLHSQVNSSARLEGNGTSTHTDLRHQLSLVAR